MTTIPEHTGCAGHFVSALLHHHFTIQCRLMSKTRVHLSAPGYAERAMWARSVVPDGLPLAGEDKQGMEPNIWIHTPIHLSFVSISFVLCTSWFLHNLWPPSPAMATELPPSRFKTTGFLATLLRLMGWQAPGLASKLKNGAVLLANMRLGDFVFFAAYSLAGLVPPLSSFLTLLEYYRLQLQPLSPNPIALMAIFVHLCEMYMGVWPSVQLFRC
jgi:hypothetical protein